MSKIEWPIDVNEIIHNRKPETIEEWAKIAGIDLAQLDEKILRSLKQWFEVNTGGRKEL